MNNFESIVMPDTPSAMSAGELCVGHGYTFYRKAGKSTYLLLPNGMRLDLAVDGKIPYLHVDSSGALGRVDEAAPAHPAFYERWARGQVPCNS